LQTFAGAEGGSQKSEARCLHEADGDDRPLTVPINRSSFNLSIAFWVLLYKTFAILCKAEESKRMTNLKVIAEQLGISIAMTALFTPPLTTMHVPTQQLGIQAARRLVDRLRARDDMPVTSRITPKHVPRPSCGCDTSRE
jgi:hypothetical protein